MHPTQNAPHEETHVKVPAVHAWEPMPACAKCGLTVGFGIPVLRWILCLQGGRVQDYGYCKGDKDSTLKVEGLGMPFEVPVECFGVFTEHIHLACKRCGWRWLMECKPAKPAPSFLRDLKALAKWTLMVLGAAAVVLLLIANLWPR